MKKIKSSASSFLREYAFDLIIGFILATCFLFFMSFSAKAQNVGINNPLPHAKSLLDLTSTDKGLLAPRMTQAQRLAMFPASDATAKGMLVYQTDLTAGFYYYDGAAWQYIASGNSGWGLTGNAGTNAAANFMGTTDNQDVVFKSNNTEGIRIKSNQNVGIGKNNPVQKLDVLGNVNIVADSNYRISNVAVLSNKGVWNLFTGAYAGVNNAAMGQANTFSGHYSGNKNTTGAFNTFTGAFSGMSNVSGNYNTFLGYYAGKNDSSGTDNVFVGAQTGFNNLTGSHNTFIGELAGYSSTTANYNTFLGSNAGKYCTAGLSTFIGTNAGMNTTTGTGNTFVGLNAGLTNSTGQDNTFTGYTAGYMSTGSNNTLMGYSAGYNATGNNNTLVGWQAGLATTSGQINSFFGSNTGYANTTGDYNCFFGSYAGGNNSTGDNNTCLGYYTLGSNSSGSNNVAVGYLAGTTNSTGGGNCFVGYGSDALSNNLTNASAIGYNAKVGVSNALVLGQGGTNVGLGVSTPGFPLNFTSTLGDKISLYGTSGNHYGFGIQPALLQIYCANAVDDIAFGYGMSATFAERMRIKGNGKVGIGTSTPGSIFGSAILEIADSTGGANKDVVIRSSNNTNIQQVLAFVRTRGTYSSPTIVQNGDNLGRISGMAYDGTAALTSAEIQFKIDSTPAPGSVPGGIMFMTTPANNGTVSIERMRVDRNGNVGINSSTPQTKLQVNGAVSILPNASTLVNANNFLITVGNNSYMRIGTNDVPANRAVVLSDGLQFGQLLMIECTAPTPNGIRIVDNAAANNTNTSGNHDLQPGDVITLLWNGTDWLEQNFSDN